MSLMFTDVITTKKNPYFNRLWRSTSIQFAKVPKCFMTYFIILFLNLKCLLYSHVT